MMDAKRRALSGVEKKSPVVVVERIYMF